MTLEERCKQTLGELNWALAVLQTQLEQANDKIKELETPPKKEDKKNG